MQTLTGLTLENDVYLQTLHAVQSLLNSELTQHFSASRLISYEILSLSLPNLHLKCSNILNPALILLVNGLYCRNKKGIFQAGYAITAQYDLLQRGKFPQPTSVQQAKPSCPYNSMPVLRRANCKYFY